jgi:hypothetical protein
VHTSIGMWHGGRTIVCSFADPLDYLDLMPMMSTRRSQHPILLCPHVGSKKGEASSYACDGEPDGFEYMNKMHIYIYIYIRTHIRRYT